MKRKSIVFIAIIVSLIAVQSIFYAFARNEKAKLDIVDAVTFKSRENSIKMDWKDVEGADGYIVYQRKASSKKYKEVAKIKRSIYLFKSLKSGTNYSFTVKAFKNQNKKQIVCKQYIDFSCPTKPKAADFKLKAAKNAVNIKWKKVAGATGYKVFYKLNQDGRWRGAVNTKKRSFTKDNLKPDTLYYFTVKAYKISNGKTYNAKYKTKSIKTEKHALSVKNGVTYIDGVLIANKSYALPPTYNPGLSKEASTAFYKMQGAAYSEGISLWICSGFRSFKSQQTIYNNYVSINGKEASDKFSARPGHSEHQSGLAIDCNFPNSSFCDTKEAKWLESNCADFGFIIRYPKEKESITGYNYEPWHIRFVGTELAKRLMSAGLTIEEYFGIDSKYSN